MSRCRKRVEQHVPRGYSYVTVSMPCGSTGITGEVLLCDDCEMDGMRDRTPVWQMEDAGEADYEPYKEFD